MVVRYISDKGRETISEFIEAEFVGKWSILFLANGEIADLLVNFSNCVSSGYLLNKVFDCLFKDGRVDLTKVEFQGISTETLYEEGDVYNVENS